MKERNFKRKLALKKAKQKRELKKALRHDIAEFLIDINMAQMSSYASAVSSMLAFGHKGYHRTRSRELIKDLEEIFANLRDPDRGMGFYDKLEAWRSSERKPAARDAVEVRQEFFLRADALMTRLVELAFDLDFEE
jgi:hypothetical protein